MKQLNISDLEFISNQFDHRDVQGGGIFPVSVAASVSADVAVAINVSTQVSFSKKSYALGYGAAAGNAAATASAISIGGKAYATTFAHASAGAS